MGKTNSSLHWVAILTAFGLAVALAVLGFGFGWDVWYAVVVFGLGTLALISFGLASLSVFLRKAERSLLTQYFVDTVLQDWKALICYFSKRP